MNETTKQHRPIDEIVRDIHTHWERPYFAAVPYLNAMSRLKTKECRYGQESGGSIIVYFLSNASTFRGEYARQLKQELKDIIGMK